MNRIVILKARCARYQYGCVDEHTFKIAWNGSRLEQFYIWNKFCGGWEVSRGMSKATLMRLLRLAKEKRAQLDRRNSARRAKRKNNFVRSADGSW